MKNLILTISFPKTLEIKKMYEISQFSMKEYSNKIKCDFNIIDKKLFSIDKSIYLEKLIVKEYLKAYDSVLVLDSDILITPNASNIFEQYSEDKIYGFNEGFLSWIQDDVTKMEKFFNISYYKNDQGYPYQFNWGVILHHKCSEVLFDNFCYNDFILSDGDFVDQSYFNGLIHKLKIPFSIIDPSFNWLCYLSDNAFKNRLNMSVIHYASDGSLLNKCPKYEQIEKDFKYFYGGTNV